jgi:hypothetical protein
MLRKIKFSLLTIAIPAISILSYGISASSQEAEYTVSGYTYRILDTNSACVNLYVGRKFGSKNIVDAWYSPNDGSNRCRLAQVNTYHNPYTGNWENSPPQYVVVGIPRNRACYQQQGTSRTIMLYGQIYCVHNR